MKNISGSPISFLVDVAGMKLQRGKLGLFREIYDERKLLVD